MTTKTVTTKYPPPGDNIVSREYRAGAFFDDYVEPDYYVYAVERPVPPLPIGTMVKATKETDPSRYVKFSENEWRAAQNGVVSDNDRVMYRINEGILTVEYQPKED